MIPKVMPHKRAGHNPKIYGYPWYVQQPIVPLRRPVPPACPPPSHMLPTLSVKESDFTFQSSTSSSPLLAVNKSLKSLPSSASTSSSAAEQERPVILKAAPGSQRTKVPLPSTPTAPSSASEEEPLFKRPKELQQEGTRFQTDRPAQGFTLMGWQNPLGLWAEHLKKQIKSFTHPSTSIYRYSCDREQWHSTNCKPSSLRTWLLRMEEHAFYLFTIKCVTSVSLTSRSSLCQR